jgi:hypothetical protein
MAYAIATAEGYTPIVQLLSANSFEETYLSLAFATTFEPACMWTYQKIQGRRRTTPESHGMHAHAAVCYTKRDLPICFARTGQIGKSTYLASKLHLDSSFL